MNRLPTMTSSLSRDFMLLSLVIVAVLSVVSLWVAYQTYEDHSDKVVSGLQNEVVRIDRELIVEIENASYLLESLGRQVSQIGVENDAQIASLLRAFDNDQRKDDIFTWIDKNQQVKITSKGGILAKSIDMSDRDYVKKALADPWKVHIGRPVLGRVTNKWVLPIGMGLTDYNGQHVGVIVVSLDINAITRGIRKEIHNSGIAFSIVSKTLAPLTEVNNSQDSDLLHNLNATELLANVDVDAKPSQVLSRASLFHQNVDYIFYEKSARYPYIILMGFNHEISDKQIINLMIPRLLQIIVIACFLISILAMVQLRVVRPVKHLGETTLDIIKGKKYRGIPSGAPLEIEQLADLIGQLSQYIEERKRIEDELLIKNAHLRRVKDTAQLMHVARTQFLESIATELDKPIEMIVEYAESMKEQHFGAIRNETYLKHAFDIHHSGCDLRQMVMDIITVARLEESSMTLNEKPVEIAFCVHRALRSFQEQPQHRHTDVKLRLDDGMPRLLIDEERFHQILSNLLNGAAGQMANGSAMVLEASIEPHEERGEELVLMLKYNMGLDDEVALNQRERVVMAHALSPLDREHASPIRSEGINIALTRMLVSLHQGTMETRISPNQVARVYIRFPAARITANG